MKIHRIRIWKKWDILHTVEYAQEADAKAAQVYVLKEIGKRKYKAHVQMIKANSDSIPMEKFSPEDFKDFFGNYILD